MKTLMAFLTGEGNAIVNSLLKEYSEVLVASNLAVYILSEKFDKYKDEWEMMIKKTKKWIKANKQEGKDTKPMEKQVKDLVLR